MCIRDMCDAMYLIMDEHMNDFRELSDYYDRHLIEDEEFCVHGYPEKMQMEFAYEDGVVKESEETVVELSLIHISEPTRLGMISYAVFCLKKKKKKKQKT